MWRPCSTYFSTSMVSSPKDDSASRLAAATASSYSSAERTMRMPLPPPPAAAFTSTGIAAVVPARDDRDAGRDRDLARGVLATHLVHHGCGRSDQLEARRLDGAGEGRALGEEPVAGVDRVGAGRLGGGHDGVDVEVALDPDGVVGRADVRARRRRGR